MKFSGVLFIVKKTKVLVLFIGLISGCTYYPKEEGSIHPAPLGDVIKCADNANHHLPSCYCHTSAIKSFPERSSICSTSVDSWLKQKTINEPKRSLAWLQEMRRLTVRLESFERDQFEFWKDNSANYMDGYKVVDDCDALDSLLDITFLLGEFRLDELAKVLIDSNPDDKYAVDHFVAAVWVNNEWMVLDYYLDLPQPLLYTELGGLISRNGHLMPATNVVAYRRLDQSEWRAGRPPVPQSVKSFLDLQNAQLRTQ